MYFFVVFDNICFDLGLGWTNAEQVGAKRQHLPSAENDVVYRKCGTLSY